jgi:hypothetical protein
MGKKDEQKKNNPMNGEKCPIRKISFPEQFCIHAAIIPRLHKKSRFIFLDTL